MFTRHPLDDSPLRQRAPGSSTSTGSGIPAPGPPAGGLSITTTSAVVVAAPPFASATTVMACRPAFPASAASASAIARAAPSPSIDRYGELVVQRVVAAIV